MLACEIFLASSKTLKAKKIHLAPTYKANL